jgi:hypothetical protein
LGSLIGWRIAKTPNTEDLKFFYVRDIRKYFTVPVLSTRAGIWHSFMHVIHREQQILNNFHKIKCIWEERINSFIIMSMKFVAWVPSFAEAGSLAVYEIYSQVIGRWRTIRLYHAANGGGR